MKVKPESLLDKLPAAVSILAAAQLKQRRRKVAAQQAEEQRQENALSAIEASIVIQDHQRRPDGDWRVWAIIGGRGSGKTWAGARQVIEHLRAKGKQALVVIVGPTDKAIRRVCLEGKSGVHRLYKHEFVKYNRSDMELFHRNGGQIICISADEPDRLEGPEATLLWGDEVGLWPEMSWINARLCCRGGDDPRIIITTTPKRRLFLKKIVEEETTVRSHATTYDNAFLNQKAKDDFEAQFGGTRLGRQNLLGEFVDEIEGAFWQSDWIERHRVTEAQCPEFLRIAVSVDPMTKKKPNNAETGITVAALGVDGHCYVLESEGYRLSPEGWGAQVVDAYYRHTADVIVVEDNQGGDMVESTIRAAAGNGDGSLAAGEMLNIQRVTARQSKAGRAEPVSVLYKRGFVHHVGVFDVLEDQQCSFPVATELKDRLDSLVYVVATLLLGSPEATLSKLVKQKEQIEKWESLTGSSGKIDPLMR